MMQNFKGQAKAQGSGIAGAVVAMLAVALQDYSPLSTDLNLAIVGVLGYLIPWAVAYWVPNVE